MDKGEMSLGELRGYLRESINIYPVRNTVLNSLIPHYGFPAPKKFMGRIYWVREEVDAWVRQYPVLAKKRALPIETLVRLERKIAQRKKAPSVKSYTTSLMKKGGRLAIAKLEEETGETIQAAKGGSKKELIHEAADLVYHLFVVLGAKNISANALYAELAGREGQSGFEEKAGRARKRNAREQ
ncbi:MAG: phosphoribosyl-ATP diphosphatase [Parvibaculales bacterium]